MVNHLMIVFDDLLNYRDFFQVGKWSSPPFGITLDLPNLKRLEARSTQFRRASAVVALCGPSRAAAMSGYSPPETGVFTNEHNWRDYLKPEHLWTYQIKRAGYYTGTVGKVFHGYGAQPQSVYDALYDSIPFNANQWNWNPPTEPTQWGGQYGAGWDNEVDWYDVHVSGIASAFLANHDPAKPFHFECGFHHPHVPFFAPNRIFESISLNDIIMPADWPLAWDLLPFPNMMGAGASVAGGGKPPSQWTASEIDYWRKSVRNYMVNTKFVDEKLGVVLDALEASPHNDNTLITCWSDHGWHLGDKGKFSKFTQWEEACNAPLLVSAPGQTTRREVWDPVSMIDIGATVCDYLGAEYASDKRGVSLRPLIEGGTMPQRLIPSYHFGSVSGAIGDFRISAYADGSYEYYNVKSDPWSKTNLAGTGNFDTHREELHRVSRDWGMQLVEEGATVKPGTPHATYLGWDNIEPRTVTSSFTVLGDMDFRAKSPGYQKMWVEFVEKRPTGASRRVRMPEGAEDLELVDRASGANIIANGLNNNVVLDIGLDITADLGEGDDNFLARTAYVGRIVVYAGAGNDIVVGSPAAGHSDTLYGGTGDDFISGQGGNDTIDGGTGNDTIDGGTGKDTIIAASGDDQINSGADADQINVIGGTHTITTGAGADTVVIMRTGQPQIITDLQSGDVLDLSDWSVIQPVSVTQNGTDVTVAAALERITCRNTTVATVSAAISGASVE